MFTRRIVIQKRVEDLQLGVKSYQKKLNISRPLTHKAGISDLRPYTAYSNPRGAIYLEKLERIRLMCTHELYKFSDGTIISVQGKLKDMANNLKMGYNSVMPRRRWSNLDKKWSHINVKDIARQLLERSIKVNTARRSYYCQYKEVTIAQVKVSAAQELQRKMLRVKADSSKLLLLSKVKTAQRNTLGG
uniref:Uncharacterized protein n=1 Tax=Tanacetum cinerariifolium TaxID=118510 RepID=A0A6L2N6P2_TANCI|nr:hypothetical protein [Tanacetum cinerariifolium]GEW21423.1 hypothetical protein [Tanacetum cinerariifolium]